MEIKKTTAQLEALIKANESYREFRECKWLEAPAFSREAAQHEKRLNEIHATIVKLCIIADIQDGLRQA